MAKVYLLRGNFISGIFITQRTAYSGYVNEFMQCDSKLVIMKYQPNTILLIGAL